MSNVTRWLRWYALATDALLGQVALGPVPLDELRTLFETATDDPMLDCFPVEGKHLPLLQTLTDTHIDVARFAYFLEAEAEGGDGPLDSTVTTTTLASGRSG